MQVSRARRLARRAFRFPALARLRRDRAGIAMTEFAIIMPFFLTFSLWGIELANYAYQTMRVAQLAAHVADNASRVGDYSKLQNRKIYESDVDDLLLGATLQAGTQMDILKNGRVIISSLEMNDSNRQYIHWQRCAGAKRVTSSYGVQNDVRSVGMGPAGSEVYNTAQDEAIMFVEMQYDYQPLISASFIGSGTIASTASFTVRSSRDLSQIYQTSPAAPKMTCDKYTATIA